MPNSPRYYQILLSASIAVFLLLCGAVDAFAQTEPAQLVFTMPLPEKTDDATPKLSAIVDERGLALWSGTATDFGIGATFSTRFGTVRGVTSVVPLMMNDDHLHPMFLQVELVRPLLSFGWLSVAGGGGIRQEWNLTNVLVGRVLADSEAMSGHLQGSLVIEKALSSVIRRDSADFVTSFGWSRRVNNGVSVGIEGIGQDLEGFWDPAEADGGAKLLVGPSIHTQSHDGAWTASVTAGPVLHTNSIAAPAPAPRSSGHHFGVFASATWAPALRH